MGTTWAVIGLVSLAAIGLIVAAWALLADRAGGRLRCPRCWYDMQGVGGLRCPECGRDARRPRRLRKTRRRWRWAAAGLVLAAGAGGPAVHLEVERRGGWIRAAPNAWYVVRLPSLELDQPQADELMRRVEDDLLREWEYRSLQRRAASVLEGEQVSDARLILALTVLRRIEQLAEDTATERPWGSWPAVSDDDRPTVVAALARHIDHDEHAIRSAAIRTLGYVQTLEANAIPALMGLWQPSRTKRYDSVAKSLERLPEIRTGGPRIPVWTRSKRGLDERNAFFGALTECHMSGDCAVQICDDHIDSEHPSVRRIAIWGLAVLGPRDAATFDRLAWLYDDAGFRNEPQLVVRTTVLFPLSTNVVDLLTRAAADSSDRVRQSVFEAIAARDQPNEELLRLAAAAMRDDTHTRVRFTAAHAYVRQGGDPGPYVTALASGVLDREPLDQWRTLLHLADLAERSDVRLDDVWRSFDSIIDELAPSPRMQHVAAFAAAMLGGDADLAMSLYVSTIKNRDWRGAPRSGSFPSRSDMDELDYLYRLVEAGHWSVPVLVDMLQTSPHPDQRHHATVLLGRVGADAAPALDTLRQLQWNHPRYSAARGHAIRRIEHGAGRVAGRD